MVLEELENDFSSTRNNILFALYNLKIEIQNLKVTGVRYSQNYCKILGYLPVPVSSK